MRRPQPHGQHAGQGVDPHDELRPPLLARVHRPTRARRTGPRCRGRSRTGWGHRMCSFPRRFGFTLGSAVAIRKSIHTGHNEHGRRDGSRASRQLPSAARAPRPRGTFPSLHRRRSRFRCAVELLDDQAACWARPSGAGTRRRRGPPLEVGRCGARTNISGASIGESLGKSRQSAWNGSIRTQRPRGRWGMEVKEAQPASSSKSSPLWPPRFPGPIMVARRRPPTWPACSRRSASTYPGSPPGCRLAATWSTPTRSPWAAPRGRRA